MCRFATIEVSSSCLPIPVPKDDPYFDPYVDGEQRCIAFVRSANGQHQLGHRSQFNQLTAYIDGSVLYGSTACEADAIRLGYGGRLRTLSSSISGLLPQATDQRACQSAPEFPCFLSGEERVSQHPAITVLHTCK
ncbi:hypothetical protein OESDEN_03883 [Oesophagostomum dentatum]|uniref:Uncharacterized protein n=1 Tax=Oesophagostomum dentatum TaxID=61180 RepID=A0A0B1TK46_OESDE|nr:hypothetical protein OESDEN_03883 [Oesophagostomum dentatum]